MNKRKKEQRLDEYLKGNSELSDIYRKTASEEPPAHIDESILSASRKAVETKPGLGHSPFTRKYYVPLSLAAVLVLCVSIVFNIYKDEAGKTVTMPGPAMDYEQEQSAPEHDLQRSDLNDQIIDEVKTQGNELQRSYQTTIPQSKPEETLISPESPLSPAPARRKSENYQVDPKKVEMIWQNKELEKHKQTAPVTGGVPETGVSGENSENLPATNSQILPLEEGTILKDDFDYRENIGADRDVNGQVTDTETDTGKIGDEYLSAEILLEQIKSLWESGEIDKAREQFKLFRQYYPDYEQMDLKNYFSEDIIEQLGKQ